MLRIAELLDPEVPRELWPLLPQVGVRDVVSILDAGEQRMRWLRAGAPVRVDATGEPAWSRNALERLKARYEEAGLSLVAIEDTPPMDDVRLGRPGREEQLDAVCEQLRAMAAIGVGVLCYNWTAVESWGRTGVAVPARGGALVTEYDHAVTRAAPAHPEADLAGESALWANFEYFLRRVVPVAEDCGVRLALHPDDPPISPVRGIGRIMRSVEAFERVLELVPSPSNGVTFCQGNFGLMTDDLPALIRRFGSESKINFVHFRDVRGTPEHFVETFHDDGPTDMLACLEAYRDVGYEGVLRPDHVPTLHGESNDRPGYAFLGRLHAVGYITGLREAAYRRPRRPA
ncbi:MAG TPA: mannonate dehydratase [Baekduia sp.]|nr:mannonate dehydratase [Baekduia sp.]